MNISYFFGMVCNSKILKFHNENQLSEKIKREESFREIHSRHSRQILQHFSISNQTQSIQKSFIRTKKNIKTISYQ